MSPSNKHFSELRNREYAEILPPGPERDLALQMLVDDSFLRMVAWIVTISYMECFFWNQFCLDGIFSFWQVLKCFWVASGSRLMCNFLCRLFEIMSSGHSQLMELGTWNEKL